MKLMAGLCALLQRTPTLESCFYPAVFATPLHVAKAGGEDDLVAGGSQVADHAFGIGTFGHVLDKGGLHLIAQRGLDGLAAFVMLARPACLGDG